MIRSLALIASMTLAAPSFASGYSVAKAQREAAPCQPAAIRGDHWRRAGDPRAEHARLLPETGTTTAQMHEFTSDARAVSRFLHALTNLIGTRRYCP